MTRDPVRRPPACIAIAITIAALVSAQPAPIDLHRPLEIDRLGSVVASVEQRLAGLDPSSPNAYFELAEEVAAEARTDDEFALARGLFALAFDLSLASGDAANAASAAIAIADLTPSQRDRRWLRAIATQLEPRYAALQFDDPASSQLDRRVAYDAAVAVGSIRSGEGARARRLLSNPSVRAAVDRYAAVVTGSPVTTISDNLSRNATQWPCPECKNERAVKTVTNNRTTPGEADWKLCGTCRGSPGWNDATGRLVDMLRLESRLLRGAQASWSAQHAVDLGAPLRDPLPEEVAATIGVSRAKPYWRNGVWSQAP